MRDFILRLVIYAAALAIIAAILPGIHIRDNSAGTLFLVALIFGILNAVVKPVLVVLSCPLTCLTLGLFLLVINGILLLLTDALAGNRFEVDNLMWAIAGGVILGLIAGALEGMMGINDDDDDRDNDVVIFGN